jgi:uncharacterized protein YoaH (UPF0181 family)
VSDHRVIFYEEQQDFVKQVVEFLAAGLQNGEGCVIIATEEHRDAIASELSARGLLGRQGAADKRIFRTLDASETLSKYMVADWPKASRFAEVIEPVLLEASQGGKRPLRLFGEMVAIEFEAGNKEAAVRIEELWNALGKRHHFSLLCAYPIGKASKVQDYTALIRVCAEHNHAKVPLGFWTTKRLVEVIDTD